MAGDRADRGSARPRSTDGPDRPALNGVDAMPPVRCWLAPWPGRADGWRWVHATLAQALRWPADALPVHRDARGKPRLGAPLRDWHFSLTHSGPWALLALARDRPVGADLERLRPRQRLLQLARRHFTAAEYATLRSLPAPRRLPAFYRLWTAKEAVLKAHGAGLAYGLGRVGMAWDGEDWQPARFEGVLGPASRWRLCRLQLPAPLIGAIAATSSELSVASIECLAPALPAP